VFRIREPTHLRREMDAALEIRARAARLTPFCFSRRHLYDKVAAVVAFSEVFTEVWPGTLVVVCALLIKLTPQFD
jgi:hypothetical protein